MNEKILQLEKESNESTIIDTTHNIILPNLKLIKPSTSNYLEEDIFTSYLDYIIGHTNNNPNLGRGQVCILNSTFSTDYFITLDFIQGIYKVPNVLLTALNNCKNTPETRFYVIPIRLDLLYNVAHSNIIIIDNLHMTIEHFEPHGIIFGNLENVYDIKQHIKNIIQKLLPIKTKDYIFKNVQDACVFGLQEKQNLVNPTAGTCLAWSLLYIQIRLNNLHLSPDYIFDYLYTFTHHDLDIYIKRFIGFLETVFVYNNKQSQIITYPMHMTPSELSSINNRINTLLYEINSNTGMVTNKSELINELISYHGYKMFVPIFFNYINNGTITRGIDTYTNNKTDVYINDTDTSDTNDTDKTDTDNSDIYSDVESESDSELFIPKRKRTN